MKKMRFVLMFLVAQAAADGYDDLTGHRNDSLYAPRYDPNAWRARGGEDGGIRDSAGRAVVDSSGERISQGAQDSRGPSGFRSKNYQQ